MLSSEKLKTILLPLKLRSDVPMSTLKAERLAAFMKCKYHHPPPAPVRAAAAHTTDEYAVVVAELTNKAESIMEILYLTVATDIVSQLGRKQRAQQTKMLWFLWRN